MFGSKLQASTAALAAVAITGLAQAQATEWISAVDSDFGIAGNWSAGVPGSMDLAFHFGNVWPGAMEITSGSFDVDSLRQINGSVVNHSGGTLTIVDNTSTGDTANDLGLWVGEAGLGNVYNLSGGVIQVDETNDFGENAFMIGRNGGSQGQFNQTGGAVNAQDKIVHVGLDGLAQYNGSSGQFNALAVQVGRFASPLAQVNLSGDVDWNIDGLVLLADGHGVFPQPNQGEASFNVTGSTAQVNLGGLVVQGNGGAVNFVADAGGVSPITLGTDVFLLSGGTLGVDLSAILNDDPTQDVLLFDGQVAAGGSLGVFAGLAEGTVVPGSNGRTITYSGGDGFDIVLQGVPEPGSLALLGLGLAAVATRRR